MPRRKTAVKGKSKFLTSGVVDIHFHGAFGVDLMTASADAMDTLADRLWQHGISAFCPTTLSAPAPDLIQAVQSIGAWVRAQWETPSPNRAFPLGIHLEGPFISPASRGAHPENAVRQAGIPELDQLWNLSQKTLKILTVAPETVSDLRGLARWCKSRKIILSLGHSRATEEQARLAFDQGFSGITHAWNALPFHHRAPGPLGAALGRKGVHIELIIDQVHVAPTLLDWTRKLHGKNPLCYVSDCVPAAATAPSSDPQKPGPWTAFGPLEIRQECGACRLKDGSLAGGGILLPEMISRYLGHQIEGNAAEITNLAVKKLIRDQMRHWSTDPLTALQLPASLKKRVQLGRLEWRLERKCLTFQRPNRQKSS